MKTFNPTSSTVIRKWQVVDAQNNSVGRVATKVAEWLMGKHKPEFARHVDCGDHVVVINMGLAKFTGKKEEQKLYAKHSGYPGGMHKTTVAQQKIKDSSQIMIHAVSGMLPKNKLRDLMLKRLHIYATDQHPYGQHFK
jgi:large subunit ribosomal protein L13